jgi:multimeric flavodoxin WrbA
MIIRKFTDKKPNILIFSGSPRKENSCANQVPKTQKIAEYLLDRWSPVAKLELIDLSVGKVNIQPCKGCISTANGMHCHWSCSCYSKGSPDKPDLMYEADIYTKLEQCDGFIIITPIHWYSVSTQVKAMFDRLVCANQTITYDQAVEIFGKGNTKNSELTGAAELSGQYKHLLKNHLEGKWAGFFAHGDDGANDYDGNQPDTGDQEWDVRNCVMPLVYQCRYSGINVPDDLIESFYINKGKDYFQANLDIDHTHEFFNKADVLIEKMIDYILPTI